MMKIRSTRQLAAAVLACGCLALALGARAEGGMNSMEMKSSGSATSCVRAQLSAWFESQRLLTDGGSLSAREVETPRDCASVQAANDANEAAPRKRIAAAAKAPRQVLRWDMEGLLGGQ